MKRKLRNIGIVAHVDAGKTTLSERILLYTGRIRRTGEVHDGNARLDHEEQEKKHGITITAAAVSCDWNDHRINLIDTPGHVDFTIEVERSLRVLDGAVCVFDAVAGVEAQTETVWRQADRYGVPRICFVNKLDRVGADLDRVVEEIRERLGAKAAVVTIPLGSESELKGVIDLVNMRALVWEPGTDGRTFETLPVPASEVERALAHRQELIEVCAEWDDSILEAVLENKNVENQNITSALRAAVCSGNVTAVLCGSAYRNIGVQPLLDAVVSYLPAPEEGRALISSETGDTKERRSDEDLVALAFKLSFDRHGQTSFVRVYSGVLRKGDKVVSARTGQSLRVPRLVRLFADAREEVPELRAGDIGAIVGPAIGGGDTLHAEGAEFALESITPPPALVEVAVEAISSSEDDKLSRALAQLTRADPSLRLFTDEESGQRRLAGMGKLHLDIAAEKLESEYGVQAQLGAPTVALRQTLVSEVEHEFTLRKQSGGPGMFAKVVLRIRPAPRGEGLQFADLSSGGAIPKEYVRGVRAGIENAMQIGARGIPLADLSVELLDGATHVKDSSEIAFKLAAQRALLDVVTEDKTVVLEPVVELEAVVAEDRTGAVVGDIGRRRGIVTGIETQGQDRLVAATVPLAETFGYAGALSAMTGGRGRFSTKSAGYKPA